MKSKPARAFSWMRVRFSVTRKVSRFDDENIEHPENQDQAQHQGHQQFDQGQTGLAGLGPLIAMARVEPAALIG